MPNGRFDNVLAMKLNTFVPLSAAELACVAEMQSNPLKLRRGHQLTQEGDSGQKAFVLQQGWACSFKVLPNGSRQIISFPIARDIIGLRSVLLRTADHSSSAITDAVVSPVDGAHVLKCVTEFPRLGAALLWAASRDEAMVVEHLVSIGRRSAVERTAHFFMELGERLSAWPSAAGMQVATLEARELPEPSKVLDLDRLLADGEQTLVAQLTQDAVDMDGSKAERVGDDELAQRTFELRFAGLPDQGLEPAHAGPAQRGGLVGQR